MKKLLLFIFSLIFFSTFAQLDREHWFGPMSDRVSGPNTANYQSIYMSTGETTPFKVDIYYDNVVIASFMVSKNNPQKKKKTKKTPNTMMIKHDSFFTLSERSFL